MLGFRISSHVGYKPQNIHVAETLKSVEYEKIVPVRLTHRDDFKFAVIAADLLKQKRSWQDKVWCFP